MVILVSLCVVSLQIAEPMDDIEDLVYIHNLYTHITLKRKQFKVYKQRVRK